MSKDKLSNQEDITLLSELKSGYSCFDEKEEPYYRALSNAIQALRADGDLISRDALKKAVYAEFGNSNLTDAFIDIIDNVPAVEAISNEEGYEMYGKGYLQGYERGKKERPQGEWILNKDENPECPFCQHSFTYWGNFCGNCGADMMKGGAE